MTEQILCIVPHGKVPAYEAIGWEALPRMKNATHGYWSRLMRWAGEGEPREPESQAQASENTNA